MTKNLTTAGVFALLVVLSQFFPAQAATPLSGAIFTTTADGSVVNANSYTSKCDVYLNGGPGQNAPAHAASLPAGDYFFQVTDPSGQTLLSTDVVNNRQFHVSADGVITAYTGVGGPAHPTAISHDHSELGAITIGLANASCPADYSDTPNNGGVYKVWITPVANFLGDPTKVDNPCGSGCFHGFASSTSKTDNFKVQPNTATFCLTVAKQLVDQFGTITPGFNWPIALTEPSGVTNNFFTNTMDGSVKICGLVAGSYTVTEDTSGLPVVGLTVSGVVLPPQPSYAFTWSVGKPAPVIMFQNLMATPQ